MCHFAGKKALTEKKKQPLTRQLKHFTIDDPEAFPWGSEPIIVNGITAGYVTSAAYGFTLGRGVVMAMVKLDNRSSKAAAKYEIELNGKMYSLTEHAKPPYDAASARVKV